MTAPDVSSAQLTARARDARVEALSERTELAQTFANPDGTLTSESYAIPVRVRRGEAWAPVDLQLSQRNGRLVPAVSAYDVSFSDGEGPLVTQVLGSRSISLGWPTALPAPTVSGSTAHYDLGQGQVLEVAATTSGFAVHVILTERPSTPPVFRLPITIQGGASAVDNSDGSVAFTTADGTVLARMLSPMMWDAEVEDRSGTPKRAAKVARIVTKTQTPELVLSPDAAFLNDPSVQYPVTVDPDVSASKQFDSFVRSDQLTTGYGSHPHLPVGNAISSFVYQSYLKFSNINVPTGATIVASSLKLYEHSSASCTATPMWLYPVVSTWTDSNLTWATRPTTNTSASYSASKSFAHGYSTSCNDAYESIDVKNMVNGWFTGAIPNYGITLWSGSSGDLTRFKSFCSMNLDTNQSGVCIQTARTPQLITTYNHYPNKATSLVPSTTLNGYVRSATPELQMGVSDPDGGDLFGQFKIYEGSTQKYPTSGYVDGTTVASGGVSKWSVPTAAALLNGHTYHIVGRVSDGTLSSTEDTSGTSWTVDATVPTAPTISTSQFPAEEWTDNVNEATFSFASSDTYSGVDHYLWSLDNPALTTATASGVSSVNGLSIPRGWHTLRARAVDRAGNLGAVTAYAFGAGGVPDAPATVTGARGDEQVSVSWSAAADHGVPVTGYVIDTYADTTLVGTRAVGPVTNTTVTGLDNATVYTFSVAAENEVGRGASRMSAPVGLEGPPTRPAGVRAAPRDGQAFLRWTPSNPNGAAVTGYTVTAHTAGTVAGSLTVGAVSTAAFPGLTNGTAYTFTVTATNSLGTSGSSSPSGAITPGPWTFSVEDGHALGADPNAGFQEDVNPGLGSFTTSVTDASVNTMGPSLEVTRSYNSIDLSDTGFGVGWTSNIGMGWRPDGTGKIVVLYPDGRREAHTLNADGSYSPPSGYASKLVSAGAGFTLTQPDGTKLVLGSNHKVTSIADPAGHQASRTFDAAGQLLTMTAFSGRRLTFTWSNGHISTVSTDPVNGASLTWSYTYDTVDGATRLISVCDPRGIGTDHCTRYEYAAGLLTKIKRPLGNTAAIVGYNPDGSVRLREDGLGHITQFANTDPTHPTITDPSGNMTTQTVDASLRLKEELEPDAATPEKFDYDERGFRDSITDENLHTTSAVFDANGNPLSTTDANQKTAYARYDGANNLLSSCDERSADQDDTRYCTTYTYDSQRNKVSETKPGGATRHWTYAAGTEAAAGGGLVPIGVLLTESDFRGNKTEYEYTSGGDLAETITPLGQRTTYAYDALGRKVSETVYSDTFPAGVTSTWTYDALGAVLTQTGPAVTNVVTGVTHQLRTTNSYDKNGNLLSATQSDLLGGDPSRTTSHTYDDIDRQVASTDSETGQSTARAYDERGNVVRVTDQLGRVTRTDYDAMNRPTMVTQLNVVDDPVAGSTPHNVVLQQTTYDPAGQVETETDALGHVKKYTYDAAGRVTAVTLNNFVNLNGTSRSIVLQRHVYDAAGQLIDDYSGGELRHVRNTYNTQGQLVSSTLDPNGLNRATSYTYDADGNTLTTTLSDGQRTETTTNTYNANNNVLSTSVSTGATSLVTTAIFDNRGIQTSSTDPRGNLAGADAAAYTTTTTADELGRTVAVALPPVQVEVNGGAASTSRPTTYTGYDTFGATTQSKDANGNVTTTGYDKLGRKTRTTHPAYTTPAGTTLTPSETWTYDAVGNQTSHVDRRGQSYDYVFDSRNRVVAAYDPLLAGQSNRGVTRTTYDDLGQRLSTVDQNGATMRWTYDALGRVSTQTDVVRLSGGGVDNNTTSHAYDDQGNATWTRTPDNAVTTATYDPAGERLTSTDASGATTTFTYDVAGRQVSTTDPLGRRTATSYDLAGRQTTQRRYDHAGALLTTTSTGYDAVGNQTSQTSALGYVTTMSYDAANRLRSVVTPGDHGEGITTTAGYDATGNMTRFTDGRGTTTVRTYTTWGLLESTIEPSTTAHPGAADRTWTTTYDAAGQSVREEQPAGVTITRTYDAKGRVLAESGTGAGVAPASRTFGYDLAGRRTTLSAPGGQNNYTFDDRGLLTGANGPSGTSTFSYDQVGRLTERQDTTGVSTFGYNTRGLLASATDPLTGTTRALTYDPAGQLDDVTVTGPAGSTSHRDYDFDGLGRLLGDKLINASGSITAGYSYGYDPDGNVTSKTITLPNNSASGTHAYTYDEQGRLKSWTNPGGVTKNYTWDAAGNRTQAGADAFTYDERNRQLIGPDGTRTWSPTGNLLSMSNGGGQTTTYTYDALHRLAASGAQGQSTTYAYDSLDRLLTSNGTVLTYQGTSIKPVSHGAERFARSIDNGLLAISDGTTARLAGTDLHHDLTFLADPDGGILGSRVYDPFGTLQAGAGTITSTLGYQSDITDPTTGDVWMGARWYGPGRDTFLSEDSVTGSITEPQTLNRYTYAEGHPIDGYDPDGHSLLPDSGLVWYRNLKLKNPYMRGEDVRWVQTQLNSHGAGLARDGTFGPNTDRHVKEFQRGHRLDVDGIVGPKTWGSLARGNAPSSTNPREGDYRIALRHTLNRFQDQFRDRVVQGIRHDLGVYHNPKWWQNPLNAYKSALVHTQMLYRSKGKYDTKYEYPKLYGADFVHIPRTRYKMASDVWGNLNYGYILTFMGYSKSDIYMVNKVRYAGKYVSGLVYGGGSYDPADDVSIQAGIDLWRHRGASVNESDLDHAVRDKIVNKLSRFQPLPYSLQIWSGAK